MRVGTLEIQIMAGLARLQKDMNDAQRMVGGAMSNVERSVAGAKRAMQTLGVGIPVAMIADQVRRMTDQYTKLDAQLRLSTKSQAQYAQGMSDIRRIATVAQADLSATSMLYTRLMNVMDGTGVSQAKLATVTETVSYGLKAYGATAQEASSAALQLSQAMGANRLGGEEFRAVMEAMPNVMKVLAQSMRVPLGELRALSIAGKITAEEMVKAFGNPAVAAEFKRLAENAQTITGAWVVARNELMLLVGEFMKSSGATGAMIAGFKSIGETFKLIATYMQQLISLATIMAVLYAGKYAVAMQTAWMLTRAHTEALAMDAAGNKAHAAVVAQAKAAEAMASNAVVAAKLKEVVAAREALFAAEAEIVAKIASARATIAQAQATAASVAGVLQSTIAKNAATAATVELSIAEAALVKIEKGRTAAHVEALAMDVVRTRELKAQTVAIAAAGAAEAARAAATLSWMGKLRAFAVSNAFGLLGLALWGAYSIADHMGWIDKVFSSADERVKKLREDILSAREIPSQVGGKKAGEDAGFNTVPGLAGDAAAAYFKAIGGVNQEMSSFIKDSSFIFSKDFLSKEQEKAAKVKAVQLDLYKELDRLHAANNLSKEERGKTEIQLYKTYVERLADLNKKEASAAEKAQEKLNKQLEEGRAEREKYWQSVVDETDKINEKAAQMEFEISLLGKTAAQESAMIGAREDAKIATMEELLALELLNKGREEDIRATALQIEAMYRLKAARELEPLAKATADAAIKAAKESAKAWENFTTNVQSNLGDVLYNGMNGKFNGIADMFKQMLMRMAADAAAANLTQAMFGNGSSGTMAAIMGAFTGGGQNYGSGISESAWMAQASYAGGGYTGNGARSGGVDGMGGFPAILHPQETVTDHARGQSGGGGVVINDYTTINIDSRSDRGQILSDVNRVVDQKQAQLVDKLQRQGQLA